MERASLGLSTDPGHRHGHVVEFYETEVFLVDTVCRVLAPALRAGDAAVIIATPAHGMRFEAALTDAGVDVGAARREGRYLVFDAAVLEK